MSTLTLEKPQIKTSKPFAFVSAEEILSTELKNLTAVVDNLFSIKSVTIVSEIEDAASITPQIMNKAFALHLLCVGAKSRITSLEKLLNENQNKAMSADLMHTRVMLGVVEKHFAAACARHKMQF